MSGVRRFHIPSLLVLLVAAPPAWLACGGGEEKPPETAADESAKSSSSGAPAASAEPASSAEPAADKSEKADKPEPAASAEPPAESKPPPAPTFGSTDCGACVDKTCAKPAAACGKNSDCQSMIDGIHSCTSGGSACIASATEPSDAKPKKLASAYQACAKKALTSKTCKAKCQ